MRVEKIYCLKCGKFADQIRARRQQKAEMFQKKLDEAFHSGYAAGLIDGEIRALAEKKRNSAFPIN